MEDRRAATTCTADAGTAAHYRGALVEHPP